MKEFKITSKLKQVQVGLTILLVIKAASAAYALRMLLALRSEYGSYAPMAVIMPSMGAVFAWSALDIGFTLVTLRALKEQRVWSLIAAGFLALLALPTWAFLVSLYILWNLLPDDLREQARGATQQALCKRFDSASITSTSEPSPTLPSSTTSTLKGLLIFTLIAGSASASAIAEPVRVSVTSFNQGVEKIAEGCSRYEYAIQGQLRTELESQLSRHGLKVLERKNIRTIYENEYELPNLDQGSAPKRNKFLSAQYTITGGVTEIGICETSSKTGAQLGGLINALGGPSGVKLGVGSRKSVSKVRLAAKIVSTETGEVIKSFDAQAEISDSGAAVEAGYEGIGAAHEHESTPPIERATNAAIADLASQIASYLKQQR